METTCFTRTSKVILLLVNILLLIVGSLMVFFASNVKDSGWLDIFREELSWLKQTTFIVLLVFGIVIMVVALLGCLGALCKSRTMLKFYNFFILLTALVFLSFTVMAFISGGIAGKWADGTFPASSSEPKVAGKYDSAYCFAQAGYYCDSGNVERGVSLFYPDAAPIFTLVPKLKTMKGFNEVCTYLGANQGGKEGGQTALDEACKACAKAKGLDKYKTVLEWANEKCPITPQIGSWCAAFIQKGSAESGVDSPYGICRPQILSLWANWSKVVSITGLVFTIVLLLFVFASITVLRAETMK